ncbi:MAG: M17 family peptidase N-terminal domain-containing protein, partial [Deltaproteobacteria bacterium]
MTLPKFDFVSATETIKSPALVLGWYQTETNEKDTISLPVYKGKRSKETDALTEMIRGAKHFGGKKNEVNLLRFFSFAGYSNLFLVGLGNPKKFSMETSRQAGAALFHIQKREKVSKVAIQADSMFAGAKPSEVEDAVQAFCEGYLLAGYEYNELKKLDTPPFMVEGAVFLGMKSAGLLKASERATSIAKATNFARSLGDRPG